MEPVSIHLPADQTLRQAFGSRLQTDVPLKRYTAARIGGNADVLVTVNSSTELAEAAGLDTTEITKKWQD
jgi:hypothetical protein